MLQTLVLSLLLVGCGHPAERKLEGRWRGRSVQNFAMVELAAATGWACSTTFEFADHRLTVTIPAEDPKSGPFEVLSYHDGKVALGVKRTDGSVDRLNLILDDTRSMRWQLDDKRTVTMQRID